MPESIKSTGLLSIIYLNRLSNAVFEFWASDRSFCCPAVWARNFSSSENQSQKLARSLSVCPSAPDSRQSPRAPGRKKRQFLQERRSLPQF